MQIKTDFLVGKQKNSEWSVVYGYRPEEVIDNAELYSVIRLASSYDVGLERIAKLLLDEFQSNFYEKDKEDDTIVKLENAVWKMKARMDMILSREEGLAEDGIDIEMSIVVIENELLYAAIVGESKIIIERDNSVVEISKGLIDANMMGFVKTGSLQLEKTDRICLATSKASDKAMNLIESSIKTLDISKLESLSSDYGIAVLILADEAQAWGEVAHYKSMDLPKKSELKDEILTDEETEPSLTDKIEAVSEALLPDMGEVADVETHTESDNKIFENESAASEDLNNERQNYSQRLVLDEAEQAELKGVDEPNKVIENVKLLSGKFMAGAKTLAGNVKNKISAVSSKRHQKSKVESGDHLEEVDTENNEPSFKKMSEPELTDSAIVSDATLITKFKKVLILILNALKNLWNTRLSKIFKGNKTYAKVLRDVGNKIKALLLMLWGWFKREIIGTGGDRRDVYLKGKRRQRNRVILVIVVVIVAIVLVVGINSRNAQLKEQERVDTAKSKTTSLKSQLDTLNSQVALAKSGDDAKKSALSDQFDKLNSDIEAQKSAGLFVNDLSSYQVTIQKSKDDLLAIFAFIEPQIISDLGKIYPDANLNDIVYASGNLYVGDTGRGVVYQMGTVINSAPTQIASGFNQLQSLVKDTDDDILFYDSDGSSSMGKINTKENGKVTRFDGLSGSVIGKITKGAVFSGNNALYEIHQNHQQIFKREQNGDTYTAGGAVYQTENPPNWRTDPDYNNAIDIEVPYEIYVLIKGQGLKRYLGGESNTITLETFTNLTKKDFDSIATATAFSTDGKFLAIGDPLNKRVLFFTIDENDQKTIRLVKQYVYRGADNTFKGIKELVVNDSSKSIYVLDGSKIVRLDM